MATVKISQLNNGATLGGTEYVPLVQNGVTVKTTTQAIANLGGGGGGGSVSFTEVKKFEEEDIGASEWTSTDGQTTMTVNGGTYTAVAGEYVEVNSTNQLRMSFPIPGSFYGFGIKCSIDSNFTPVNTNNWYSASTILAQELGGEQADFGLIIDKNGKFAIGYANASIYSTDVTANDGQVHSLFIVPFGMDQIRLFIDGVEKATITSGMKGTQMSQMGVFWNKDNPGTRVNGKIYAVGSYSADFTMQAPTI